MLWSSYSDRVDIQVLTELNSGAIVRFIVIVLIYRFNRAEIGCYGQSYSGRVDIHVLTELNSGAQSYSDRVERNRVLWSVIYTF